LKRLKPRRAGVAIDKEGYLSIDELRQATSANAIFRKIKKSKYE
jgi:RNA:NAD 2'-phosphotransferase (TPT1/KptA family)